MSRQAHCAHFPSIPLYIPFTNGFMTEKPRIACVVFIKKQLNEPFSKHPISAHISLERSRHGGSVRLDPDRA